MAGSSSHKISMPLEYEVSINIVGGKALLLSILLHSAILEDLSLSQEPLQILLWTTTSDGAATDVSDKGGAARFKEVLFGIIFLYPVSLVRYFLFYDDKNNGSI